MVTKEFSEQFDTLLNSYASKTSHGDQVYPNDTALDEYEKSVFLTKAQEMLVEELYTGNSNDRESYEETERLRRSLANLNVEKEYSPKEGSYPINNHSQFFEIDDNVMFITYEAVRSSATDCLENKQIEVVPVRQDWFHRQVNNPFRGATTKRALRLDRKDNVVEIIYPLTIDKYYIRYIRRPNPIILADLDGLQINGKYYITECELDESLHRRILDRAVYLALASKGMIRDNNE